MAGPLFKLLQRRTGSTEGALSAITDVALRIGTPGIVSMDEQLAGLALCAWGEEIEKVSKCLTWKDFEKFCSGILQGRGYRVKQNIFLRKPRAQIDAFGVSEGISLAVDCKHWARPAGHTGLVRLVEAQKARARRLRENLDSYGPIATVVLLLVDEGERFVSGGAVVPVFAFGDFLDSVEAFRDQLELV